jgi:spore germination protein YaaH
MRIVMFDSVSMPLPLSLLVRLTGGRGRHTRSVPLTIGLATALAVSACLIAASPAQANNVDTVGANGPSIQYQEAMAHAADRYSFAPGGAVTVPFRPRPGDSVMVDGAAPVALPAGQGSTAVAPNLASPGPVTPNGTTNLLRREVFGFLPYWELGSTLDYNSLSTIAYFGIDLNTDGTLDKTGNGWNGWESSTMTSVITNAHAHGTRVALTVESFAWGSAGAAAQTTLLSSPAASLNAAQQIAAEVHGRGADGVDLDFEPIAPGQSANYIAFVRTLRAQLDALHPGYELTFCATGHPSTYDLANLLAPGAADAVFIMGYNFRGGTPATTGSIDPLTSPTIYDLTSAVDAFTAQVDPSKVILGLPWYGEAWSTGTSTALDAPPGDLTAYGQPAEVYYSTAAGLAAMSDSTHLGTLYDPGEQTAWTAYYGNYGGTQSTWRELYFDDARALGAKCAAIDGWNLRGAGIWALGYDNNNGDGDLTNAIASTFETQAAGATYVPIAPTRLLDTRAKNGISGKLAANVPQTFQVTGRGGVPANATAVTGDLTVADETNSWAVYLGPVATAAPTTSNLNFERGDIVSRGQTVGLSSTGTLSATYMSTAGNTTDLVFDVTGYFVPDASGATYMPLSPTRLLDTRVGNGLSGALSAGVPATFQVAGRGGVPATATAVTGNLTIVDQTKSWAVALGPNATPTPTTSTINFAAGQVLANSVTVGLSSTGTLSATYISTKGATTDLVFDVTGYFASGLGGSTYIPVVPARLLDTRVGNGLAGPFSANVPGTFQVTGLGGVPSTADAVTGQVTAVNQTNGWAAYVGPDPVANPGASTVNFLSGQVRGNGLTVGLGTGGTLSATYISTSGATTDLVVDVTGYFAP